MSKYEIKGYERERVKEGDQEKEGSMIDAVDLAGAALSEKKINEHLMELQERGFIVFENVGKLEIDDLTFSIDIPKYKGARKGTQLPHIEHVFHYHDGKLGPDMLIFETIGETMGPEITDPKNPHEGPERAHGIEPATFVVKIEDMWQAIVAHVSQDQTLQHKIRQIISDFQNRKRERDMDYDPVLQDALRALQEDILRFGPSSVGDQKPTGTKSDKGTWLERFMSTERLFRLSKTDEDHAADGQIMLSGSTIRSLIMKLIDEGKGFAHYWKANQVLVVDNNNMMHGRFDITGKGGHKIVTIRAHFLNASTTT